VPIWNVPPTAPDGDHALASVWFACAQATVLCEEAGTGVAGGRRCCFEAALQCLSH
jgi:hypothetical protein